MTWSRISKFRTLLPLCLVALCLIAFLGCPKKEEEKTGPQPGKVLDEAMAAGRDAASLPAADEDYYHDMDGGVALTPDEVKGRNTWVVFSGGNDHLWDTLSTASAGTLDLLKTVSSHPSLKFSRDNRWTYLGLVNEPCFDKATGPDPDRFGLWLDKRRADCPPDPFENEAKYPGIKFGARGQDLGNGKTLPVGSLYGWGTGIVGLRLFPNPAFDAAAAKNWDPVKYYTDSAYYLNKNLVRPYRIGMSCGFCHVGPSPTHPPADPENPQFADMNSMVGAQYLWIDRVFAWDPDMSSYAVQLFHTSRPGTVDTSLVSSDNINNPRTMNAFYSLNARLVQGKRWGKETLAGGGLNNKQFNDYIKSGFLTELYQAPDTAYAPRVLKDGADSVGSLGALNRVFINIGLFSEEWLLHFKPLIGGQAVTPIEIAVARKNSSYWLATESQTPNTALYFLKASTPHYLKDAPGGAAHLTKDAKQLTRGKVVFAERCARCHSSKLPDDVPSLDPGAGCSGANYLDCWNKYWASTKTEEFKAKMREIVLKDDFLTDNYLSTELRVPVTLLETNACSPLATNGIAGNVWDNFSSQSYKDLPSVGTITVHDPFTGEAKPYKMPAGGRGYTRPPSLASLWSTAPFLLNNSVGKFNVDPSVEGRLDSFQDSIEKMLWPEKRDKDSILGDKVPGLIDRTTQTSYLRVPRGYLPPIPPEVVAAVKVLAPTLIGDGGLELGPIPAGMPVNLLSNLDITPQPEQSLVQRAERLKNVLVLLARAKHDLIGLPKGVSDQEALKVFANLEKPLINLSKCPDFVVNRGHYFGTSSFKEEPGLSDADKRALIEFLKTL